MNLDEKSAADLERMQHYVNQTPPAQAGGAHWVRHLEESSDRAIAAITGWLRTQSNLRESARMVLDERLNARSREQMEKLEWKATLLGIGALVFAAVQIAFAVWSSWPQIEKRRQRFDLERQAENAAAMAADEATRQAFHDLVKEAEAATPSHEE